MFTDPTVRAEHVRRCSRDIAVILACLTVAGAALGAAGALIHDLLVGRN